MNGKGCPLTTPFRVILAPLRWCWYIYIYIIHIINISPKQVYMNISVHWLQPGWQNPQLVTIVGGCWWSQLSNYCKSDCIGSSNIQGEKDTSHICTPGTQVTIALTGKWPSFVGFKHQNNCQETATWITFHEKWVSDQNPEKYWLVHRDPYIGLL